MQQQLINCSSIGIHFIVAFVTSHRFTRQIKDLILMAKHHRNGGSRLLCGRGTSNRRYWQNVLLLATGHVDPRPQVVDEH